MTGTNKGPTKALTLITGGGDIARDSARSEEAGVDRGEDSGGEHGRRTRRVAGVHTERRAERQRRGGARAGCRVAARALVGAAQRRARWVPRSGAGSTNRVFLMCDWSLLLFICILRIKITRKPQPENYVTSTWPPAPY